MSEPRPGPPSAEPVAASGRTVLFGATGYTGQLTAREMVARGMRPVLAARGRERVAALAAELGGLEVAVADVGEPASVAALVGEGDVLVSTVGPFLRWGGAALEAALGGRAHYLDSTGESAFIRRVFEEAGPRAQAAGVGLLTAMGYDFVPGNLAGALALREAGGAARRVEVGYFWSGAASAGGMSGGTRASAAGAVLEPAHTLRDGVVVTERGARRIARFEPEPGRQVPGVSIGASEQYTLPRLAEGVWDVDVYLGWFGPASRPLQGFSALTSLLTAIPGARGALQSAAGAVVKGSTGGPDAEARAQTRSIVIARALDVRGEVAAEVRLEGPNGYDLTAGFLAWGAERAAAGDLRAAGALGPVDAFGLEALEAAAAGYGLLRAS